MFEAERGRQGGGRERGGGRVDERRSVTRPSPPTSAGLINLILLRIAATTLLLARPDSRLAGHVRLQSVNDRFEDRSFAERKPRNNHRGFTVIAPREMRNSFVRGGNVQLRKNWLIVVARDGEEGRGRGAPLCTESRKSLAVCHGGNRGNAASNADPITITINFYPRRIVGSANCGQLVKTRTFFSRERKRERRGKERTVSNCETANNRSFEATTGGGEEKIGERVVKTRLVYTYTYVYVLDVQVNSFPFSSTTVTSDRIRITLPFVLPSERAVLLFLRRAVTSALRASSSMR